MAIEGRSEELDAPIRLGMVGGGSDAFIGGVHRIASRIDDHYRLVAGALSSTPERAQKSGRELGLAEDRIYDDFNKMAEAESAREDGIEAVAIKVRARGVPVGHRGVPSLDDLPKDGTIPPDQPVQSDANRPQAASAVTATSSDRGSPLDHNLTFFILEVLENFLIY